MIPSPPPANANAKVEKSFQLIRHWMAVYCTYSLGTVWRAEGKRSGGRKGDRERGIECL